MRSLQDVNGQEAAIQVVLSRFDSSKKQVILLSGPPGSGVTWTLQRAAESWERLGGKALQARGEAFATERKLFPWLALASPGARELARHEVLKNTVSHSSRAIPIVGQATSHLVEELLNHKKKRLSREAVLLSEAEQDLLFVIQNVASNRQLLLTLDHLETWDNASLQLLGLILSDRLDALYPPLASALIVVGASHEIPTALASILSPAETTRLRLQLLKRDDMPIAATTFSLPLSAQTDLEALHDITNGRLDLLRDLGIHLNRAGISKLPETGCDMYGELIESRIRSLGEHATDLRKCLAAAAILGQSFVLEDLRCLIGATTEVFDANLRLATTERFLSRSNDIAMFESSFIHGHFHRPASDSHLAYHRKFAECLQLMRPGDYGFRLHHLIAAGKTDEALSCYALARLASKRENRTPLEPNGLRAAGDWPKIENYLAQMEMAYDTWRGSRHPDVHQLLDQIEDFLPSPLLAERDYVEAEVLLKSHRISDYEKAVQLLKRWEPLRESEGEIWSRLTQVLMVAQVQIGCVDEARKLEAELTSYYWEHRRVDPWALYSLNLLRRRSECLHQLPTATQRLESALAYFGSTDPVSLPRHPIQYYYTLNNLVGNLICSGKFSEAEQQASQLDTLIRSHPSVPWPRLEVPANNAILAAYLAASISATDAVTLMERVLEAGTDTTGDHLLIANNRAVFLVHAGRPKEALDVLENLHHGLEENGPSDEYHRYFIGNNLAALRALSGEESEIPEQLRRLKTLLESLYPALRQTLVKRHDLLAAAFSEVRSLDASAFDSYLFTKYPAQIGSQWKFYARGFLFSDVQFWSAD